MTVSIPARCARCTSTFRCSKAKPRLPLAASLPATAASCSQTILEWATGQPNDKLACQVQHLTDGRGRGLVATQDIPPGQIILRVPFTKAYTSEPEHELELHWSADMALRLLQDCHACQQASGSNSWCTWLASLPEHVPTPLEFGPCELAAVRDPLEVAEINTMQDCMRICYQELQPQLDALGCGWHDFLNAAQVWCFILCLSLLDESAMYMALCMQLLHSRCFFQPETGCHTAVPGIDMANHSLTPTARVEVIHSPGAVQGMSALEEVVDVDTARQAVAAEPSCWVLRAAGAHGIRKGEEVTISYGPWPDTAFFRLFGFLPTPDNPNNSVVLFADLQDLVQALVTVFLLQGQQPHTGSADRVHAIMHALRLQGKCDAMKIEDPAAWYSSSQLVVTKDTWDARLPAAVRRACQLVTSSQQVSANGYDETILHYISVVQQKATTSLSTDAALQDCIRPVVRYGCEQKLAVLMHTEEGTSSLTDARIGASNSLLQLAQQFTARQVHLLQTVLTTWKV